MSKGNRMKIMVVGVGRLGSQVAFMAMLKLKPENIILSSRKDLSGDILDLQHAAKGMGINTTITDKKEPADFIVITSGIANTPVFNEEKMLEPLNRPILKKVDLNGCTNSNTTVIIMTNPVHEMTDHARKLWPDLKVVNPEDILLKIRNGEDYGSKIIKTKGYTNFGAAVSAVLLIEQISQKRQ